MEKGIVTYYLHRLARGDEQLESLDDAVRRLLRSGTDKREICFLLGVSREKVNALEFQLHADSDAE